MQEARSSDVSFISFEAVTDRTSRGFVALLVRTVFMRFMGFAGGVILARVLAPEEFGVFVTVNSIILFFTFFRDVGLSGALIQKRDELTQDDLRTTFTIQQILVSICVLVIYVSATYIARFYGFSDSTKWLIRVMSVSLMTASLKSVPAILLERQLYFDRLAAVDLVEQLSYYVIAVGLALLGFGVWSLIWGTLLRGITGLIVLYCISPWQVSLGISWRVAKDFFAFGVPMQGIKLVSLLKDNMMPLLGGAIYGATAVGYLNWAWSVSLYTLLIGQILGRMMFPAYSRVQKGSAHLQKTIERNLRIMSLSTFPVAVTIMALAPDIVHYIYTDKWAPAIPALYFLCINAIGGGITSTFFYVIPAIGDAKRAFVIMLIWTVAYWTLVWPMMALFGYVGFAVNYAVITTLASFWLHKEVNKIVRTNLWGNMRGPLLASLVSGVIVYCLRPYVVNDLVTFLLGGMASLALFVLVLFLIERERLAGEIRTVISFGAGWAGIAGGKMGQSKHLNWLKVLFISNLYPPHHLGGYELRCHDVVTKLEERGHQITVLTSTYGVEHPVVQNSVHRVLTLESDIYHYQPASLLRLRKDNRHNLSYLSQILADFQPDVIFIWGMWNLSKLIAREAERQAGSGVVYSIADMWPTHTDAHTAYWQRPARRWLMRLPKGILVTLIRPYLRLEGLPATLRLENVICVSKALRDNLVNAGVPVENARVIYSGIVLDDFLPSTRDRTWSDGRLSLLYVGRLVKEKGAHTAVLALAELVNQRNLNNLDLTFLGWGSPEYVAYLKALADDNGLREHINFLDPVPRAEMPQVLSRFDILVFPSIWEEPFSRAILEAMASELAVVGTTTGGGKEILVDGENALTFTPGDAHDLARQIERLALDPALRKRLVLAGASTVQERFDIERMMDQIEAYLLEVARGNCEKIPEIALG